MAFALSNFQFSMTRKQMLMILGGVVVAAAAGWGAMEYFDEPPPPPPPPKPAAKPAAAKAAPSPDKLAASLLDASGMKQQMAQLPQQLIAGVKQSSAQLPKSKAKVAAAIEQAVAETYKAERFQERLAAELKKNFDQKRVQALLDDYAKPAAKQMVEREQKAPSPEELAQFVRNQTVAKLAPARSDLVKRIDAATRASDLAIESALVTMKALATGIAGDAAQKTAAVDKAIEKQRAAATQTIRNATFAGLVLAYKDASDAELEGYAKFYESENSKWFSGIVFASIIEEAKSAAAEAGARLGALAVKSGAPAAKAVKSAAKTEKAAVAAPAAERAATSKRRGDARACLELASNAAIMKCAEGYR